MTDEMRVALVAVALAQGVTTDAAWSLVDKVAADGRDLRDLVGEVGESARSEAFTVN